MNNNDAVVWCNVCAKPVQEDDLIEQDVAVRCPTCGKDNWKYLFYVQFPNGLRSTTLDSLYKARTLADNTGGTVRHLTKSDLKM